MAPSIKKSRSKHHPSRSIEKGRDMVPSIKKSRSKHHPSRSIEKGRDMVPSIKKSSDEVKKQASKQATHTWKLTCTTSIRVT